MVTVNNRIRTPIAHVINGIDVGGIMTARILAGCENRLKSSPDGIEVPLVDKYTEYVRGNMTTQDWVHIVELLTGAVGTHVFHERKYGVVEATGYIKHTITAPIIHRVNLSMRKDQYMTGNYDFECRPADETKGIDDMWTPLDSQAAPTYIAAARGGWRIASAVWNTAISIYHVTAFDLTLATKLVKESNDLDVGYTCCEAVLDGLTGTGSITFQDATIAGTPALLKLQTLVLDGPDQLLLTITQGQGGAAKVLTLKGVDWTDGESNSTSEAPFTEYTANFEIVNDPTTQLTLAGTNKILDIT